MTQKKDNLLTEKAIRLLIADNRPEAAIDALTAYADVYELPDWQDDIALQSARWEAWAEHQREATLSPDTLSQQKNQLDKTLLALNRKLFQELRQAQKEAEKGEEPDSEKKGIREDKFKIQIFVGVVLTKLIVISWVFFHYSTGGLSRPQTLATVTLLLPVFAVYLAAIFDDFLDNRHVTAQKKEKVVPYIKNSLRWITYGLFPIYAILMINVIGNQAQGVYGQEAGMEEMNQWLGLIESGLGVYIGRIVFTLFKK